MMKPIGLPVAVAFTRRIVMVLLDVPEPPRPMWYWPSDMSTLRFSFSSLVPVPKPAVAGWKDPAVACAGVVIAVCSAVIHSAFSVGSLGSCGVVMEWLECTQMLSLGVPVY